MVDGHFFIDLNDYLPGLGNDSPIISHLRSQVKVSPFVHGGHLQHGHINRRGQVFLVQFGVLPELHRHEPAASLFVHLPVKGAEVGTNVVEVLRLGIDLQDSGHITVAPNTGVHRYIGQLLGTFGQGLVQVPDNSSEQAIVDPVTRPHFLEPPDRR